MNEPSILTVFCTECQRVTSHDVRKTRERRRSDEDYDECTEWQMVQCRGCEEVRLRREFRSSANVGDSSVEFFPRGGYDTLRRQHFQDVPWSVQQIYNEVIKAFNEELLTLCAAGSRAVIEAICGDKGIKEGTVRGNVRDNLEGKIAGLVEANLLSKPHADALHQLRFLGNSALHELDRPESDHLNEAIKIIEHTLESIYGIPERTDTLRQRRT